MVNQTLPGRGEWGSGYSTYDDVENRLRARRGARWRAGETSFGLVGRILLTVPVLLLVGLVAHLGLRSHPVAAVGALTMLAGVMIWCLQDLWGPRR